MNFQKKKPQVTPIRTIATNKIPRNKLSQKANDLYNNNYKRLTKVLKEVTKKVHTQEELMLLKYSW